MQDNNTSTSAINKEVSEDLYNTKEDYSIILEKYGVKYYPVDFYWQVGKTNKTQGWILHISVIAPQLSDLLHQMVPVLLEEKVSFKVAKDRGTARTILDGNLGLDQIGKVMSIYPEDDPTAIRLSKKLVDSTKLFRGPSIPTDAHLGSIVYTRYGSFSGVSLSKETGEKSRYIYTLENKLVEDTYQIPFQLPNDIPWPFHELASPILPKQKNILNDIYKPLSILKPDARGNVIKALYLKGFLRVGTCVIKQGKKNMLADDMGRDIVDRLIWQRDLHSLLKGIVPLPLILDLFEDNGDMYLVMEFIKGKSFQECLTEINSGHKTWFQLSIEDRSSLFDWLLQILSSIKLLHENGLVHRDIAPGNFLINHRGEIILIDTELAYNLNETRKDLPFELGTPGFMSPEQESVSIPTIKEDIYGLGALMISIFTGLSPVKFNTKDEQSLFENLIFFMGHQSIARLICACTSHDPYTRPQVTYIQSSLKQYKQELLGSIQYQTTEKYPDNSSIDNCRKIIEDFLEGISKRPMPVSKGLWMSKTIRSNSMATDQKDYSPYIGLHTGMGGVLYLLARANRLNYDISASRSNYETCWQYVKKEIQTQTNSVPGFYTGNAGIGLALAEGISSGLLANTEIERQQILACCDRPNEQLNLADGIAGQCVALLQSTKYIDPSRSEQLLSGFISRLLATQQKNGSWKAQISNQKHSYVMPIGLSHGISGIIWLLLEYSSRYQTIPVEKAISDGLSYLLKRTKYLKGLFDQNEYKKIIGPLQEIGDERTGTILCFIKAFEVTRDVYFKDLVENALNKYPDFVINNNLSQNGGITCLGEIYLEAARVFNNKKWKSRADNIASVLTHLIYREKGRYCYWKIDEGRKPTADLLPGNSGIIHFLLRCLEPDKLGYILLK